jgi:hypothetical protein
MKRRLSHPRLAQRAEPVEDPAASRRAVHPSRFRSRAPKFLAVDPARDASRFPTGAIAGEPGLGSRATDT